MKNPYHVLELPDFAAPAAIKSAYRKLSKRYHPDLNGGSKMHEVRFQEIVAAYECLTNPTQKARLDRQLRGEVVYEQPRATQQTYYYQRTDYRSQWTTRPRRNRFAEVRSMLFVIFFFGFLYLRFDQPEPEPKFVFPAETQVEIQEQMRTILEDRPWEVRSDSIR